MLTFVKISTDMIILQILPLKNVYNNINCSHLYNAISFKKTDHLSSSNFTSLCDVCWVSMQAFFWSTVTAAGQIGEPQLNFYNSIKICLHCRTQRFKVMNKNLLLFC